MRLDVIDMPENWSANIVDGVVCGVFSEVVNISFGPRNFRALDARRADGKLPGTARVQAPPGVDFRRDVTPGARVSLRAGILRISGSEVTADFRHAASLPSDATAAYDGIDDTTWMAAWKRFVDARVDGGFANALCPTFRGSRYDEAVVRRVRSTVPLLLHAVATNAPEAARDHLSRLIGVGPGLTPSGDDFAAGFILGLGTGPKRTLAVDLAHACTAVSIRSTDISRHYLQQAALGHFASAPVRLAQAIATGERNAATYLDVALAAGHSSGSDTAFGLLCGLATHSPRAGRIVIENLETGVDSAGAPA